MNFPLPLLWLIILGLVITKPQSLVAKDSKPNIIIILADDLGYGDLSCYQQGSKIPTPNLDRLAAKGMRFTQAYCPDAVCSPSRYALMTGRYPWRSWKKHGVLANWEKSMIENHRLTIPSMLQKAGYVTAGFGKWHLGANYTTTDGQKPVGLGKFKSPKTGANIDLTKPLGGGPMDRGFDHWYGFVCASEMLIFEGQNATSVLSHDLYDPPSVPGAKELPSITVKEYLPHITNRSLEWMKSHVAQDEFKPFFLYYAPYVPHIPLTVSNEFLGKTKAGEYGDYVHQLDHEIGRLLQALEECSQADNTLILFASDNGSQFQRTGEQHRPNGNLRGIKGQIYEGGVRTPLIACWPGIVPAGSVNDHPVALIDFLATLAAVVDQSLSPDSSVDSINLLPLFKGESGNAPKRETIVMQSSAGQRALRKGRWKYIKGSNGKMDELYDLSVDPGENNNLIVPQKTVAAEMQQCLLILLSEKKP